MGGVLVSGQNKFLEPVAHDLESLQSLSSELDANTTTLNGRGRGLQVVRKYKRKQFKKIICPFLSTLVRQKDLPVQDVYTRSLLEEKTVQAGLDPLIAKAHVDANFANIPLMDGQDEKVMAIFDMEG